MRTHFLPLLLLFFPIGLVPAQAQECCQGFEASFSFGHGGNLLGVAFENGSTGQWDSAIWHFGDGTTSHEASPDHMYAAPGLYQVCLVIENAAGCRSELCRHVGVGPGANPCEEFIADFTHAAEEGNPLSIGFEDASTGAWTASVWQFGDGGTSNQANPGHIYESAGLRNVCHVVESASCRSKRCRKVPIGMEANPCEGFEASFTYVAHANGTVVFHNALPGSPYSIWHFGDGTSASSPHAEHSYEAPGLYQVCLVIEGEGGCRSELCRHVAVGLPDNRCQGFVADFAHEAGLSSLTAHFEAVPAQEGAFHAWHFGDGHSSTQAHPSHQYDAPGIYQACLVIEHGECRSKHCHEVCMEDSNPCEGFGAHFTYEQAGNPVGIHFDGHYSGSIGGISWDFGDGHSSSSENPAHEFPGPGLYEVCLTAENSHGCHSQYCITVSVGLESNPCAGFEAAFAYTVDLLEGGVHFDNLSTGDITHYQWSFGSHDAEPVVEFEATGLHEVCLVIENTQGCRSVHCAPVHVPAYYFHMVQMAGVAEELPTTPLRAWPNPFNGVLQLGTGAPAHVSIIDMQGRVLRSEALRSGTIDLSGLLPGLYIARMDDGTAPPRSARVMKL